MPQQMYVLSLSDDTHGWDLNLDCFAGKMTKERIKHQVYKTMEMIYGSHDIMEAFCKACDDLIDAGTSEIVSKSLVDLKYDIDVVWSFRLKNA